MIFFKMVKNSESGEVEELIMDHTHHFKTENGACICFYASYKSFPKPSSKNNYVSGKRQR